MDGVPSGRANVGVIAGADFDAGSVRDSKPLSSVAIRRFERMGSLGCSETGPVGMMIIDEGVVTEDGTRRVGS